MNLKAIYAKYRDKKLELLSEAVLASLAGVVTFILPFVVISLLALLMPRFVAKFFNVLFLMLLIAIPFAIIGAATRRRMWAFTIMYPVTVSKFLIILLVFLL